jgi:hypothetical protein
MKRRPSRADEIASKPDTRQRGRRNTKQRAPGRAARQTKSETEISTCKFEDQEIHPSGRSNWTARHLLKAIPPPPPPPPPPSPEELRRQAKEQARDSIRAGKRVFFYPACGFDYRPIKAFADVCDTFVYCDWGRTLADFTRSLKRRRSDDRPALNEVSSSMEEPIEIEPQDLLPRAEFSHPNFRVIPEALERLLTRAQREDYRRQRSFCAEGEPWGRLVRFAALTNAQGRNCNLIYLRTEGVITYHQLFCAQGAAPEYIAPFGVGYFSSWTHFENYDEALGLAIESNERRPEFVVGNNQWPWNVFVRETDLAAVWARPAPEGAAWVQGLRTSAMGRERASP